MNLEKTPVLIVGGGPTGLTAALLLARSGIPVLLLERRATTSIHPRARGLNMRTMEIYRSLGLEEAIRTAGSALAESRYMLFVDTLSGKEIRRVSDEDLEVAGERLRQLSPCTGCQCAQDELEPILLHAAQQYGAKIRFGTELISFTQEDTGVEAHVVDRASGTQYTISADYMLAADGANSRIRQALAIQSVEKGTHEYYVNIYFRADLRELVQGRWFALCFVENPEVNGILMAVNNTDRWLLNVPYLPENGLATFTNEHCIELVRKAIGIPDLAVEILSMLPWESTARVADTFQSGHIFLAGDAAHVMPPAGGFGLNTGVQDAHNLAWKLAARIHGVAADTLLGTYNAERRPVALSVVEQAVRELEAPTPDTLPIDEVGGQIDPLAIILGYSYQSQAVIGAHEQQASSHVLELNGQPGTRAPHVWIEREGKRISTLDLFDGRFVLLVGEAGESWVADRIPVELAVYRIGAKDEGIIDLDRQWYKAYGVTEEGYVLVRPDGFVAWRSVGHEECVEDTIKGVFGRILG